MIRDCIVKIIAPSLTILPFNYSLLGLLPRSLELLPHPLGAIASPFRARKTEKEQRKIPGFSPIAFYNFKKNLYALYQSVDSLCMVNKKSRATFN